jgi:hypothetical protein
MPAADATTFELRIDLDGVDPAIWRTFVVPGDISLGELHLVIQVVMGWTNSHLHQFRHGRSCFGPPDPFGDNIGAKVHDEAKHFLDDLLTKPKQRLTYEYDFGDAWEHTITVVAVRPGRCKAPKVLAGERACPPEDCGGARGYADLLETIADPLAEGHAERLEWYKEMVPEGHDPEVYPIAAVNKALAEGIEALVEEFAELADWGDEDEDDGETGDTVINFPRRL